MHPIHGSCILKANTIPVSLAEVKLHAKALYITSFRVNCATINSNIRGVTVPPAIYLRKATIFK